MYSLSFRLQTTDSFVFDYEYGSKHCVFTAYEHPGVHNTRAGTTSLINVNYHADHAPQTDASVPHRSV